MCWIAWNSEIGRPNCLRSLEYLQRGVVRALRHPDGERGDGDAAAVQHLQAVDEAVVQLAEQLLLGQAAVFEDHLAGGAGAQAELVFLLAGAETGRALFDDEGGDAVLRGGAIGDRHGDADVGVVRVGGEGLGAVEHPAAVFEHGLRARARGVATRLRARSATSSRSTRPVASFGR